MRLTKKNKLFIECITDRTNPETYGNGVKSAIRAGYSTLNAASISSQLLRKLHISKEIAQKEEKTSQQAIRTKDGLLKELYSMLSTCTGERNKLAIMDRIILIEGHEAPKKTENKNENMNLDINGILDKAQDAMREELAKFNRG